MWMCLEASGRIDAKRLCSDGHIQEAMEISATHNSGNSILKPWKD